MKICLVCSSGGHLLLLSSLRKFWQKYDRCWVTFDKEDARSILQGEKVYYGFFPTNRNLTNLFRNFFVSVRVLIREKPDIIVSTGAGIAVPFFLLGKLTGKKLVFIEAYERVKTPSLTGKLVYPFTDIFVLQWEEQKKHFPRGRFLGQIL